VADDGGGVHLTLRFSKLPHGHREGAGEQKAKLTQLINEGIAVLQEVEDLSAGLNDTVKAVAEELEIKPSLLKKAIKIAQKSKLTETNADHETVQDILETVGRTV
jgi:transposase-like protein